jgi:hypothetical protein
MSIFTAEGAVKYSWYRSSRDAVEMLVIQEVAVAQGNSS